MQQAADRREANPKEWKCKVNQLSLKIIYKLILNDKVYR